jgi:hypothetical protein
VATDMTENLRSDENLIEFYLYRILL